MFDIFDWVNSKCLRVREFIESTLDTEFILVYIQGNQMTKYNYNNINKLLPMDPDILININTFRYKSNSIYVCRYYTRIFNQQIWIFIKRRFNETNTYKKDQIF